MRKLVAALLWWFSASGPAVYPEKSSSYVNSFYLCPRGFQQPTMPACKRYQC